VTSDISQGSEGDDIITCMDAITGFEVTFSMPRGKLAATDFLLRGFSEALSLMLKSLSNLSLSPWVSAAPS